MHYQKDVELGRRVNQFLAQAFGLPAEDYFARLNITDFLRLKAALADINNVVTMRLTLSFVDWIARVLAFDGSTTDRVRNCVLESKPSSNGYDVVCNESTPFIAEVKCNVPINGSQRYGSAQRVGILSDIDALLSGKAKAAQVPGTYLKFMVFLDLPEVRAANLQLLRSGAVLSRPIHFLAEGEKPSDPGMVYVVHLPLGVFQALKSVPDVVPGPVGVQPGWNESSLTAALALVPVSQVLPSQARATGPPDRQQSTIAPPSHRNAAPRPSKADFAGAIRAILARAGAAGDAYLDVRAGSLHTEVGGYPGINHAMPSCCAAMYGEMNHGDEVREAPPKGRGANLVVRYRLPRSV